MTAVGLGGSGPHSAPVGKGASSLPSPWGSSSHSVVIPADAVVCGRVEPRGTGYWIPDQVRDDGGEVGRFGLRYRLSLG
jgi:hypothetical protein